VGIPPGSEDADISAQLQGGGLITCTVQVIAGSQNVTQTAQASGSYNIAMAEVCNVDGWQKC